MSSPTSRREFLKSGMFATAASVFSLSQGSDLPALANDPPAPKPLPHATPSRLPRWRGFNLLQKFNGMNKPFNEDDFRNISDLGFNFVRLPMDYRAWIVDGDRRKFNEKTLSEIDKAVEYGQKYGIHVHLNFHRAPGYTVARPQESPLVWNDEETLDVCRLHWQTFAKRYRNISGDQLSFNLFNEPAGCTEEEYFKVAKTLVDTIRKESPQRLISCDGIDWGTKPCFSFKELQVAQSTRGYSPMEISHYGASWVDSKNFPYPRWPFSSFNGLLPSPSKKELSEGVRQPLTLQGPFPDDATLRVRLGVVSNSAELLVKIDEKEAFRRLFVPKDGKGEWKEVVYSEQYKIYQNIYDLDLEIKIPNGAQKISIATVQGDWASLSELGISTPTMKEVCATSTVNWHAQSSSALRFQTNKDGTGSIHGGSTHDRQWLWDNNVAPWKEAEKQGIGIMVGEFGAHNVTPIDVVLRWMEDMLINWQEAGWGWALWNFTGSFGVANSERKDVDYEDWRGLKLDRKMLDLLQRY